MLQASLKVIGGKNDGKLIEFKSSKFLVGREHDCHLRPNSDLVSRHHCVFTVDDYALRLRDLGSTNGTLVNGRRIRGETVLTPGDVVRIGKLNLEVVIKSSQSEDSQVSPAQLETTRSAAGAETARVIPQQTLDDSGMISTSASSETVEFEMPIIPSEDMGSDEQIPLTESDTIVAGSPEDHTMADTPIINPTVPPTPVPEQPQYYPPNPQAYPPEGMPQQGWQYPMPPYGQYPQYQPYPGYPMGYPPQGYPQGYGFPPQPGQYPPNYQQPAPPPEPEKSSSPAIPEVRLPDPEDTGVKDEPKPAAPVEDHSKPKEMTPSQRAAEMISRRRRQTE